MLRDSEEVQRERYKLLIEASPNTQRSISYHARGAREQVKYRAKPSLCRRNVSPLDSSVPFKLEKRLDPRKSHRELFDRRRKLREIER